MAFSKMVDMAREPVERPEPMPATLAQPSGPEYPYGLCIALSEEELAKLGLDGGLPEVGMMIHLSAMAKVTSVSQHERETSDGKTNCCRVELQITHLAAENEDEEDAAEERRERFYGGEKEEAA